MSLAPNDLFTHLLPQWQFEERHDRLLRVSPAAALAAAAAYRPDGDRLIAGLIALREWPGRLAAALGRPNALGQRAAFGFDDFTPIGQDTEHLAFGLVGASGRPTTGCVVCRAATPSAPSASRAPRGSCWASTSSPPASAPGCRP